MFKPWPKTPRLNRGMIITEKIDGTNAAVIILPIADLEKGIPPIASVGGLVVMAQSRNRLIWPAKNRDNAGFAAWVSENAERLVELLGEGYHYGEWWGKGVQHGYGQDRKRFSLFNVVRYEGVEDTEIGLDTVPILYRGPFDTRIVKDLVLLVAVRGSAASAGHPCEGVIIFHEASNSVFKVTCKNDETPKGNKLSPTEDSYAFENARRKAARLEAENLQSLRALDEQDGGSRASKKC